MSAVEPKQIWWTADELAASGLPKLPGSKRGINSIAERNGWRLEEGCFKRKAGRGGGYQYHWSVLPLAARRKLLKEAAETPDERPDRGTAWAVFEQLPERVKTKAKDRLAALDIVDGLYCTGVSHVHAIAEAARQCGSSQRSIYNWLDMIEGVPPEDRLAYLAPRNRIAARKATKATCNAAFMDYLKSLYLRLEQPTFAQCHRLACKKAEQEGWDVLVSKTAQRRLNKEVPRVTQVFAREGVNGLMRCYPAQIRDRSSLTALEAVNADCHKIDTFVEWPDGTINRPQIVAFQDLYSGKILSWRVDHDPNKVMVMAAFGEMVENWGIPKRCLFDNGREFANKWMTAGAPTRFRFKICEDDPKGVLPLLGIKMHWATPAHGQAKPIERAFRDLASDVAKDPRFAGAYVGNRPDAKPENYGSRAIKASEFLEALADGIIEHNARTGRRSPTAKGRSFDETFEESYAVAPIQKATEEQRRLWMMGQATAKLHKSSGQLTLHDNVYHCAWMSQEAGRKIIVRFDPEDLHSGVHIYGPEGGYLGFAECQQKIGFFDLEGARSTARRRRQIVKAEKVLRNLHKPISTDQIAADMNKNRAEAPSALEAKVVKGMFPKKTPVKTFQNHTNREATEARDALILELSAKQSSPVSKTFEVAKTPDGRFEQVQEIQDRKKAGKPVGEREAAWMEGFLNHPEYEGLLAVKQSYSRNNGQ
ncbi:transposase domain-containing protein [Parasedimentitalea huanghaiensis]|uniref:DDE-type integrase/transposase/recombinase n=1 Tax=Parasedimentitalea huanghaiensis TaxID=2682100 RepID=A0A6L6WLJ4_9RHOB|nr:transposase domain-containing protein [Zongyanglinia huanghaiensis]MVO16827.1 DDE-type integrase/transposase/recombinase [Zongyanglinia huanghaiensis]